MVPWKTDGFAASLTSVSDDTKVPYLHDVNDFVEWAGNRAGLAGPEAVTRLVLRRYLAFLTTMGRKQRSIARAASALRRYFGWLRRTGAIEVDPSVRLTAPHGESRLPHVLPKTAVTALLDEPPAGVDSDEPAVRMRDD